MKTYAPCLALISLCSLVTLRADTVINPVNVTLTGADQFFPAIHVIDGSGLNAQPNTGDLVPTGWNHLFGDVANNSWVSGAFGFPSDWFAVSGTIPTFVLDLGQEFALDKARPQTTGRDGKVRALKQFQRFCGLSITDIYDDAAKYITIDIEGSNGGDFFQLVSDPAFLPSVVYRAVLIFEPTGEPMGTGISFTG